MTRAELKTVILSKLSPYHPQVLGFFGSYARGEENDQSDIDLLLDCSKPLSLLDLVKLQDELSTLSGKRFDIVTLNAIKNAKLKAYIMKDFQSLV